MAVPAPLRRFVGRKAASSAASGQNAGWSTYAYSGRPTAAASHRRLSTLLGTFGGTEDSVSWVYACTSLVMQEMASYPSVWRDPETEIVFANQLSPPQELRDLIREPNEEMTYADFIEFKAMDEELAGNSYWLKDQTNGLGQPLALRRLRPEHTQIAVDPRGRKIGYVYHLPGAGITIPYNVGEVIHFKRPNPLNEYYGMGTVEAIQRELNMGLAATDHITGFFSEGARISGVLTTGTLSQIQFERFKEQFVEEYAGQPNAHKILIAEEGTKFEPIQVSPVGSGIQWLFGASKDAILSAFGVHEFLLGGAHQAGVFKMSEAQQIFGRRMAPKVRRTSDRITMDLVRLWSPKIGFWINITYAEPREVKVARAKEMLAAGAAINEARKEMDLPPVKLGPAPGVTPAIDLADLPVMPQGFAPYGTMLPSGAPSTSGQPDGGGQGSPGRNTDNPKPDPAKPAKSAELEIAVEGFEAHAPHEYKTLLSRSVLRHQSEVYRYGAERFATGFRGLFADQRGRVARRLGGAVDTTREANSFAKRSERIHKKDLTADFLWTDAEEDAALRAVYEKAADEVAARAATTDIFAWRYDENGAYAQTIKDGLGRQALRVNAVTKERVGKAISEGQRRGYSVNQITNGVPAESYPGVLAVFDDESRLEAIGRTETAFVHNTTMLYGLRHDGHTRVEVLDGNTDDGCAAARGQVWHIEEAARNLIEHPRCVRTFAPLPSANPDSLSANMEETA